MTGTRQQAAEVKVSLFKWQLQKPIRNPSTCSNTPLSSALSLPAPPANQVCCTHLWLLQPRSWLHLRL
ncbi:hypothetical protein AWZ03_011868 [Drosophila navojoa]|uniref:Uncharacterized protein n=1 Tax=Drosophila navojoa TaxID=7232 RepID=A0A484AYK4_DRONA|nr:hypothetical protein AWZ03_011868 [Drosophila navojoa]